MPGPSGRTDSALILELLLRALLVDDPVLNALAIELSRRIGVEPVRRLVLIATDCKNRPAYRLRALEAIERLGATSDVADFYDLASLLKEPHQELREATARLLVSRRRSPTIERPVDSDPSPADRLANSLPSHVEEQVSPSKGPVG